MTKIKWFRIGKGDLAIRLYIPPSFEICLRFNIPLVRYEVAMSLLFVSVSYNWERKRLL